MKVRALTSMVLADFRSYVNGDVFTIDDEVANKLMKAGYSMALILDNAEPIPIGKITCTPATKQLQAETEFNVTLKYVDHVPVKTTKFEIKGDFVSCQKVSDTSYTIRGLSEGVSTITFKTTDDKCSATCKVTVTPASLPASIAEEEVAPPKPRKRRAKKVDKGE